MKVHVNYGESIGIIGNIYELGNWNIQQALPLKWTDGDLWTIDCTLDHKSESRVRVLTLIVVTLRNEVEYKYIKIEPNGNLKEWMPGNNLTLLINKDNTTIKDNWETSQITHNKKSTKKFQKDKILEDDVLDDKECEIRVMTHSSGKEFDIGGELDPSIVAYGPDPNPLLESLIGSSVLTPIYPSH